MATTQKRWCFDLDGTLCTHVRNGNYAFAEPIENAIQFVRDRKAEGDYIIIDTARGTMTGYDWRGATEAQLTEWRCPFDELHVGTKPFAHVYVDDKAAGLGVFDTPVNLGMGCCDMNPASVPQTPPADCEDPAKDAGPQTIAKPPGGSNPDAAKRGEQLMHLYDIREELITNQSEQNEIMRRLGVVIGFMGN